MSLLNEEIEKRGSCVEELTTCRDQLSHSNSELTTVRDQLTSRLGELTAAHDQLIANQKVRKVFSRTNLISCVIDTLLFPHVKKCQGILKIVKKSGNWSYI